MNALCSNKVTPVESRPYIIYLLNVVVKQEILIKTQNKTKQNKTGDVLSCYTQPSSIHYSWLLFIHVRIDTQTNVKVTTKLLYTQHPNIDSLKIICKKTRMFCGLFCIVTQAIGYSYL